MMQAFGGLAMVMLIVCIGFRINPVREIRGGLSRTSSRFSFSPVTRYAIGAALLAGLAWWAFSPLIGLGVFFALLLLRMLRVMERKP